MSLVQDRIVFAATLLTEATWFYAGFTVIGVVTGSKGSPLGFVAIVAILVTAFLIARTIGMIRMPIVAAYSFQMLTGLVVLYLTLGTQFPPTGSGLDLGWAGNLSGGPGGESFAFQAALAAIFGIFLWWRAARLASSDYIVDNLSGSFKFGIMVISFAAIMDIIVDTDMHIFPLMFLFFASGITGLSIGQILPVSQRALAQKAWPKVIGGIVSVILVAGLLFSFLRSGVLTLLSTPMVFVLNLMALVIFFVIIYPIAYLVDFLIRGLRFLAAMIATETEDQEFVDPGEGISDMLQRLREGAEEQGPSLVLQVIEWTLLAIIIAVILFFLAKAFRRRVRWRRVDEEGTPESITDDVDPAYDMARLLFNLIPKRFRIGKTERSFTLPDDEADIVEVFRIYFGLLTLAEERGYPRPTSETPTEYQKTLEMVFPAELVRSVTAAFVRACYGHHPAPRQQIEEMRVSVERLASQSG